MEYKIGETFEFNGKKKLKCVLNNGLSNVCEKCALYESLCFTSGLVCTPNCRKDETDVYFIELKKENNMPPRKLNNNEDVKEQIITPPDGYEIDKENSTFECIKFKKKEEVAWKDKVKQQKGFIIDNTAEFCTRLVEIAGDFNKLCIFNTEKQAKSALAMAHISQIMANDKRFGGVVTDKEWKDFNIIKYVIFKGSGNWIANTHNWFYTFLAFHTNEQCQLFIKENEDLIKDYLMID